MPSCKDISVSSKDSEQIDVKKYGKIDWKELFTNHLYYIAFENTKSNISKTTSNLPNRAATNFTSVKPIPKFHQDQISQSKLNANPVSGKKVVGYVLHCKFTGNNTILTLTSQYVRVGKLAEGLSEEQKIIDSVRPLEDVNINLTTGILGFRNTKQGEYEAGFQTAARMFALIEEQGYFKSNTGGNNYGRPSRAPFFQSGVGLEIIMSNFGKGREAFLNALNGAEGNKIRRHVNRVTDNTKIKFGGVRPPRARRV